MRMETFITKALGLRAHRVVKIEEDEAARNLVVHLDRREHRRLQCGECGRGAGRIVHATADAPLARSRAAGASRGVGLRALSRVVCTVRVARRTRAVGGEVAANNARVGARGR